MFTEDLRYQYPINPFSIVMDVGAHKLKFASEIQRKHGCKVLAFEPVSVFRSEWPERNDGILFFPFGIGGKDESAVFKIKGDMTGKFADSEETETVEIRSMKRVLSDLGINRVHLLKINIEGSEFDLLEHILSENLAEAFDDIQVQFHPVVEDAEVRHLQIQQGLLKTHQLTYNYPWCWENYERIRVG